MEFKGQKLILPSDMYAKTFFNRDLIEASIKNELSKLDFSKVGLTFRIEFPLGPGIVFIEFMKVGESEFSMVAHGRVS